MSTFCNDKDIPGIGFVSGIDASVKTSEIEDKMGKMDYHVRNKMGTSIPSALARLFLFNSAYVEITEIGAHLGIMKDGRVYSSIYHHIISEHLDMLEFIFRKGSKMKIYQWEKTKELVSLTSNNEFEVVNPNLKSLGDALKEAIDSIQALKDLQKIRLFFYDNEIVGGTSPRTLIYTNPNWARYVERNNPDLGGLFKADVPPKALHERDEMFRQLMCLQFYRGDFNKPGLEEFREYVKQSIENYDGLIRNWWRLLESEHQGMLIQDWINRDISKIALSLKDDKNDEVTSETTGVSIYTQVGKVIKMISQYQIKATVDFYKDEIVDGAPENVDPPLILPERGIDGAIYYGSTKWDNAIHRIPPFSQIKDLKLSQRYLPGTEIKFPFLTIDDLFENKIIETAFFIDNARFFTGTVKEMKFLLPLKKEVFKFFTLDDIKERLSITYREDNDENEEVTVSLTIPLLNLKKPLELTRTYSTQEGTIFDCHRTTDAFNLGIFPFFRINEDRLNIYNIIVGSTTKNVEARFFKFENIKNEEGIALTSSKERTRGSNHIKTKHLEVRAGFDLIEMSIGQDCKGLVIALMGDPIVPGIRKYIYAIDFGTSNTHIAYADFADVSMSLKSLKISHEEVQVAYLNGIGKNYFSAFEAEAKREFPPKEIGEGANAVKFPMRTAVYEIESLKMVKDPNLFSDINIGFNYQNEIGRSDTGNCYQTDLKWNLADLGLANDRIKAYCKEILWILRNKALLNRGSNDFIILLTYPQAMRKPLINNFKTAWVVAQRELNAGNPIGNSNFKIESIAPYYRLRHLEVDGVRSTDVFVNIDIGGGSTDILYVNPNTKTHRSYSAFFAANDLWGTGIDKAHAQSRMNGFVISYERLIKVTQDYKDYKEYVARNASDLISHLFGDPRSKFPEAIKSADTSVVVVMHFAAIIYYLQLIIAQEELKVPRHISFTGMGSKYISMISSDLSDIENVINTIFRICGLEANVKVHMADNPKEVTAEGAVYLADPNEDVVIPTKALVYGVADEDDESFDGRTIQSDAVKQRTLKQYKAFTSMLQKQEFIDAINECGDFNINKLKDAGLENFEIAENSYIAMSEKLSEIELNTKFEEPVFFWPIKETLYNLALNLEKRH